MKKKIRGYSAEPEGAASKKRASPADVRKTISINIKNHRRLLGLSQEKLAEKAGISSNMVRDIEGCRTWVSDNTLSNIAAALETDIYRLFMPENINEAENYKTVLLDMNKTFNKIKVDVNLSLEKALKLWKKKK
jgi:transcriptional regulator with XRE-family HTH domain